VAPRSHTTRSTSIPSGWALKVPQPLTGNVSRNGRLGGRVWVRSRAQDHQKGPAWSPSPVCVSPHTVFTRVCLATSPTVASGTFSSLCRVLCTVRSLYLYTIGLASVLRLARGTPRHSSFNPKKVYSQVHGRTPNRSTDSAVLVHFHHTGLSPTLARHSRLSARRPPICLCDHAPRPASPRLGAAHSPSIQTPAF
jgi:hypothetical protein